MTFTAPPDDPGDPGGGGTPPAGGGSPPAGADVAPPAASVKAGKQKLEAVLAEGLALSATFSEPCTLKLQLVLDKKTAKKLKPGKKATVVGRLTRTVSGTAKLTAKAKKRLNKAKSVKLAVKAVATDAAGNAASAATKATLRR